MKVFCFIFFEILFSLTSSGQDSSNNIVEGKPVMIGRSFDLYSTILHEKRNIIIYLPEGYNVSDTIRYQVIYLLDGGPAEDFIHITGLVQFCSTAWVQILPQTIVVGIATTDRRRDFTFPSTITGELQAFPSSGGSAYFMKFIESELQPFIDGRFRTTTSKTLIGESLGGLFATEVLLKRPDLFTNYIIVSPSLWWNDGSLTEDATKLLQKNLKDPALVYIGAGREGLAPSKHRHVMEVDANDLADKLKASQSGKLQVFFNYLPQENHATILHQAVYNAFRFFKDAHAVE